MANKKIKIGKERTRRVPLAEEVEARREVIRREREKATDTRIKKNRDILERRKKRNKNKKWDIIQKRQNQSQPKKRTILTKREKEQEIRKLNKKAKSEELKKLHGRSRMRNIPQIKPYKNKLSSSPTIKNLLSLKKRDRVFIVAGGESISNLDLTRLIGEDTIVINKALFSVPNANIFVSMDNTFSKKIAEDEFELLERSRTEKLFVANFLNDRLLIQEEDFIYDPKFKTRYNLSFYDNIIKAYGNNYFGKTLNKFYTGNNSGFCALQLAILMEYKEIYLLGMDLSADKLTHYHGGYGESTTAFNSKLAGYKNEFIRSIGEYKSRKGKKSKIISCSKTSTLNSIIKYINYDAVIPGVPTSLNHKRKSRVKGLENLIVVGYYTIKTPYEAEAKKTIKSCENLGLDYDIIGIPNLGSWQANTRYKAKFMIEMLDKHPDKNLLYVDCDAIIRKVPILFENYNCDIAVRYQDFRWRKNECLSGTIYMENNEKTRSLCEIWLSYNKKEGNKPNTFEQWNLGHAIQDTIKTHKLIFKNLPPEYCFIFDHFRNIYKNLDPIIEHFQASRKLKIKVNK